MRQECRYLMFKIGDFGWEDDLIICFVMNSENNYYKYHLKCNKQIGKFILKENELSFIRHYTSIMLKQPIRYSLNELINSKTIDFKDIAPDLIQREIKNCIDFGYLLDDESKLIRNSFK